jgi:hypothetical protein
MRQSNPTDSRLRHLARSGTSQRIIGHLARALAATTGRDDLARRAESAALAAASSTDAVEAVLEVLELGRRTTPLDPMLQWFERQLRKLDADGDARGITELVQSAPGFVQWYRAARPNLGQVTLEQAKFGVQEFAHEMEQAPPPSPPGTVVFEFDDGWTIVQLPLASLKAEGTWMQNCLANGYYDDVVESGEVEMYALRSPTGVSRVNFAWDVEDEKWQEIQGRNNKPPVKRYRPYVRMFRDYKLYGLGEDGLPKVDEQREALSEILKELEAKVEEACNSWTGLDWVTQDRRGNHFDGSYANLSLSDRLEWHCQRVNNEDALLEAIKRAEDDGATDLEDVIGYLGELSVDELRDLLESVDHDVFSEFEDDEGEDDGDDGPFVEAMNEVRDDMVATIEYVVPRDREIIDYINDVESSAVAACDHGQSAVVQAIDAEYGIAVDELRDAARIESEYGDDPTWGPVLDWFEGVLNDIEAGTFDAELDNTPYAPGRPVTTKPSSGSDVAGKRRPRRYNTTDLARRLRR